MKIKMEPFQRAKQNFSAVTTMVQFILEHCLDYEWSLQGFGMLRLYVPNEGRINVWDSRYRVPNVSMIHTHPWHFDSLVIKGQLQNQRYVSSIIPVNIPTHSVGMIKPGIGGGMEMDLEPVILVRRNEEEYERGDWYHQHAAEIHMSLPSDGCVTFNVRERVKEDKALVYWPYGEQWVDAIPRKATSAEVSDIVKRALDFK